MLKEREQYFEAMWERLIRKTVDIETDGKQTYSAAEVLKMLKEIKTGERL